MSGVCRGGLASPSCTLQGRRAAATLPRGIMQLRGGMPDVGEARWTSDYDRKRWNQSNPEIQSPLFVPEVADEAIQYHLSHSPPRTLRRSTPQNL